MWLEQYPNSGNEYCISNHTLVPGNFSNVNETDYWIYLSSNPNPCPLCNLDRAVGSHGQRIMIFGS